MAIVTEAMRRGSAAEHCDVAVVGAGLPGLVAAAVLARAGARVVLVEAARRPGGRLQTIAHQGFAIDVFPPLWEADGLHEALLASGVAVPPLAPLVARRDVYAAVVEGGAVRGGAHPLPVPGAVPSPAALEAVAALVGAKPRTWASLGEACAELLAPGDEQATSAPAAPLGSWASSRSLDPSVTAALLRCAAIHGAFDPAQADVRRIARLFRRLASGDVTHLVASGHAVTGARAVVESLLDAAIASGVEMRLGTRALALDVDRGRARGVVLQREEVPFLATLAADRVVFAVPPTEAARLLPPEARMPPAPRSSGSLVGFAFGLRAAPWPEDAPPPPAVRLVGPAGSRDAPGAPRLPIVVSAPQAHAPGVAPPGQALLLAHAPVAGDRLDAGEASRLAPLLRSAVLDLHPGAEIAWERTWFRSGEAVDPFLEPSWPEVSPTMPEIRFAGWGIRLARCVTGGVSCAAATALAAAHAPAEARAATGDVPASLGTSGRTG